jgi:crotonobetainyl-CoA:carnitine CoA-transferase CaiB-like acyl-CoA transferase
MLLAELGADVVRIASGPPDEPPRAGSAARAETACLDRGKILVRLGRPGAAAEPGTSELDRLRARADVLITDESPREHRPDRSTGPPPESDEGLIQVWMPPYGPCGEWADLPDDPLLLAALGGIAAHHPASHDVPVAPVVPTTAYIHGALAATAAVAALVERQRTERVRSVTVTGLQAVAAQMTTLMVQGLDVAVFSPGKALRAGPNFRLYQAGDGMWFILAALTPALFVQALGAVDQLELLLLPGIDGEPANILVPALAHEVGQRLEQAFQERPRPHWLAMLSDAAVPCAPVATRADWAGSELARVNQSFTRAHHPVLGSVRLPDVPLVLSATPGRSRPFADERTSAAALWPGPPRARFQPTRPGGAPLDGIRVLDMATFLAAPFAGAVLAGHGAAVVKLEPLGGDPYRSYPISFLSANQRKQGLVLDLKAPAGRDAFLRLLRGCDVLIENLRPGRLERLGLSAGLLESANPGLVHCSVSAYGHTGPLADTPGFDPVFQALSGLAAAQGGAGEPVTTSMPPHDTAAGSLAALGIVASLLVRERHGFGQQVHTSLARAATFLQSVEFTDFEGRPPNADGGRDFPGPGAGHRYYRCEDGWIAIAAPGAGGVAALAAALSLPRQPQPEQARPEASPASIEAGIIEGALAARTAAGALETLRRHGIAACPVLDREQELSDAFLVANQFSHVVEDFQFGRVRVVSGYADWTPAAAIAPAASFRVGEHTGDVLRSHHSRLRVHSVRMAA